MLNGASPYNKSLQVTFDPPPTFAAAKAGVASNAPELRRWATCAKPYGTMGATGERGTRQKCQIPNG